MYASSGRPRHTENKKRAPLPPGWDLMIDEETGQQYFVDHINQTTSWVDPREADVKPKHFYDCEGDELPYGWEKAFDPKVGTYFIDHNTWTTQLEDPRHQGRPGKRGVPPRALPAPDGGDSIHSKQRRIQLLEQKLAQLEQEMVYVLSTQTPYSMNPMASKKVDDLVAAITELKREIGLALQDLEYDMSQERRPRHRRADSGSAYAELDRMGEQLRVLEAEKRELELLIRVQSGNRGHESDVDGLRRELMALQIQAQQNKEIMDLRLKIQKLELEGSVSRHPVAIEPPARRSEPNLNSELEMQELVVMHEQEKNMLMEIARLMESQENVSEGLKRQIREVIDEHQRTRADLLELKATKDKDMRLLREFLAQGTDEFGNQTGLVTNSLLRKALEDFRNEIDMNDAVMPKSEIEQRFSNLLSELDVLRRSIEGSEKKQKFGWGDDYQSFLPLDSQGNDLTLGTRNQQNDLDKLALERQREMHEMLARQARLPSTSSSINSFDPASRGRDLPEYMPDKQRSLPPPPPPPPNPSSSLRLSSQPPNQGLARLSLHGDGGLHLAPEKPQPLSAMRRSLPSVDFTLSGDADPSTLAGSPAIRTQSQLAYSAHKVDERRISKGNGKRSEPVTPTSNAPMPHFPKLYPDEAPPSMDHPELLEGEEWLLSADLQEKLKVGNAQLKSIPQLRLEMQSKVCLLEILLGPDQPRLPHVEENIAYHETHNFGVHPEIRALVLAGVNRQGLPDSILHMSF